MKSLKTAALAASAVGLSLTLSSCAGEPFADDSADDVAEKSIAAMKELKSVRFAGDIDAGGQAIELDLSLNTDGNCTGSISLDGSDAEVRSLDGTSWFKPSESFLNDVIGAQGAPPEVLEQLNGKWLLDEQGQFSSFCDLDELVTQIAERDGESEIKKGEVADVDGTEALTLLSEDESGEFDEEITVEAPPEEDVVDPNTLGG